MRVLRDRAMKSIFFWRGVVLVLICVYLLAGCSSPAPRPALLAALEPGEGYTSGAESLEFDAEGSTLAAAYEEPLDSTNDSGRLVLWNLESRQVTRTIRTIGVPTAIAFSRDGKSVAAGSGDGTLRVWSVATGKLRMIANMSKDSRGRGITALAFSPDGRYIATGDSQYGVIRIAESATGRTTATLHTAKSRFKFKSIHFSSDGAFVATAGIGTPPVQLWDMETTTPIDLDEKRSFEVESDSVAFSPDKRTVAIVEDNMVKLFDLHARRVVATYTSDSASDYSNRIVDVAFSSDGKTITAIGVETIAAWDTVSRRRIVKLSNAEKITETDAVAISPDGRTLALISNISVRLLRLR